MLVVFSKNSTLFVSWVVFKWPTENVMRLNLLVHADNEVTGKWTEYTKSHYISFHVEIFRSTPI